MAELLPDLDRVKTVPGSANLITILKKPDVSCFFDYTANLKPLTFDNQNFISKKNATTYITLYGKTVSLIYFFYTKCQNPD